MGAANLQFSGEFSIAINCQQSRGCLGSEPIFSQLGTMGMGLFRGPIEKGFGQYDRA